VCSRDLGGGGAAGGEHDPRQHLEGTHAAPQHEGGGTEQEGTQHGDHEVGLRVATEQHVVLARDQARHVAGEEPEQEHGDQEGQRERTRCAAPPAPRSPGRQGESPGTAASATITRISSPSRSWRNAIRLATESRSDRCCSSAITTRPPFCRNFCTPFEDPSRSTGRSPSYPPPP